MNKCFCEVVFPLCLFFGILICTNRDSSFHVHDPQVDLMFFQDVPEAVARHALQRTGDFFSQGEPINECLGISGRDFESRCIIGVGWCWF